MDLANRSDEEILAVANPIMDNLMAASARVDHAMHVRDFTDRLKAIVTPEHLAKVCARYRDAWDHFARREVVGLFRCADSVAVVWKQRWSGTDDEVVAEMVLIEVDGRHLVDHVVFF